MFHHCRLLLPTANPIAIGYQLFQRLHFFSTLLTKVETSVSNRPKMNAHKNPSILIPETNLSARRMMMTFITKRKSPRVIIVKGSVRMVMIGLMKMLSNANTIEKINAVSKETIET